MDYKADEFRNVALLNKPDLRKKTVIIPISDNNYQFKISGIGQKAIKLEKYFYYSEIIDAVQEGIDDGLEFLIEQIIIDLPIGDTHTIFVPFSFFSFYITIINMRT